jgi:hypothetical protein
MASPTARSPPRRALVSFDADAALHHSRLKKAADDAQQALVATASPRGGVGRKPEAELGADEQKPDIRPAQWGVPSAYDSHHQGSQRTCTSCINAMPGTPSMKPRQTKRLLPSLPYGPENVKMLRSGKWFARLGAIELNRLLGWQFVNACNRHCQH